MLSRSTLFIVPALAAFITACSPSGSFEEARESISVSDLERLVRDIGSDQFMGREPFTEGEKITVEYLAEELRNIGFEPAFGDSYFQEVPMVKIRSVVKDPARVKYKSGSFVLNTPEDAAIISPLEEETVTVEESELIFAGFGIVAPDYGWNDYAGLDVRGKTVIVLINDPGLYTGDSSLFKGNEMTYYGRWTYKYEEAARQGAEGILIIHEPKGAGYSYNVPRNSSVNPNLYIGSDTEKCRFTGWIRSVQADRLLRESGHNTEELRTKACGSDFRGFSLGMNISLEISNTVEYNSSRNVAGVLRGTLRPEESIVYTAHWDHFGIGEPENTDSIFNGAVDNGTSMAWELAIGKAFSGLRQKPERSIVLLFPTAEEQGLTGSLFYTEHPVFPIEKTVACLNNDLLLPIGRMKDLMITGYGQSDLDDYAREAAEEQERYVAADPNPHTGMYFRSDHFSFAKKGVPSLFARGNTDSREHGKDWAAMMEKDYLENRYHRPADNYDPLTWDLEGVAEDARLAFTIGWRLSMSDSFPAWKPGSEFKSLRE
ncbi:MAG: M28 family peptidase [Bacteroidales bacterium]|jgi:Zn-dependent M28 family amino/carboxypeptidase|nr:M28 family peptidase [Bacteroidales bacterium]